MSRNGLLAVLIFACGLALGTGLVTVLSPAQAELGPADGPAAAKAVGPFQVVGADKGFVMYEPATGKTWVLIPKEDSTRQAWLPVTRLDSEADVQKWQIRKEALGG